VLALLVAAPLLAPGYLLLRDAVATPRSYLSDSAIGLSQAAPRATATGLSSSRWPPGWSTAMGACVVKVLAGDRAVPGGLGAARLAATVCPTRASPVRSSR